MVAGLGIRVEFGPTILDAAKAFSKKWVLQKRCSVRGNADMALIPLIASSMIRSQWPSASELQMRNTKRKDRGDALNIGDRLFLRLSGKLKPVIMTREDWQKKLLKDLKMEFEEFYKKIEEIVSHFPSRYTDEEDRFAVEGPCIVQVHLHDGADGGDCWGSDATRWVNENPPQSFLPLDEILRFFKPEISYLDYRKIEQMIEVDRSSENDYYGNYNNFKLFKLDIRKLYGFLFKCVNSP